MKRFLNILLLMLLWQIIQAKISRDEFLKQIFPSTISNWARIGTQQSPINLWSCEKKKFSPLVMNGYDDVRPDGFTLENTGNVAQISYSGAAPTLLGGPLSAEYTFKQAHFHWGESAVQGSEHTQHGISYATEMHFVHYKTDYGSVTNALNYPDGLAVIGLWFKISLFPNPDLTPIIEGLRYIQAFNADYLLPSTAMTWMKDFMNETHYYTYPGSLTTPAYNEVVTWVVFNHKSYISKDQLDEFRQLLRSNGTQILKNRREVQPLDDRIVFCSSVCDRYAGLL